MNEKTTITNQWIGPKRQYCYDKELCEFYTQMNVDCRNNHSKVIWEWLKNAPCLDDFAVDKFKIWKAGNDRANGNVRDLLW